MQKKIWNIALNCLILSLITTFQANAQILNIDKMAPTLNLSPDFLNSLEQCSDYTDQKSVFTDGSEASLRYEVKKDGAEKCRLIVVAETDHYVHIEQNCLFPLQTAAQYAIALRKFNDKHYSIIKETFELNKDENYKIAAEIMQNSDLCRFTRTEIDNTKGIRENLSACQKIKTEEKVKDGIITREIFGRDNNFNCHYDYTLWMPAPDVSHIKTTSAKLQKQLDNLSDMSFHYTCSFDDDDKREYILLLESLVLPQEEGYNFTSVGTFNSKIETEFIINHCEYVPNKSLK